MHKVSSILFAGMMFLSVAACGNGTADTGASSAPAAKTAPQKEHKVLVAYYFYSGNTQAVAKQIAQLTGGDLFEIQTVQTYPASYNDLIDQAKKEINAGYKPELKNKVADISKYDVVFIGSPNWWGTFAPAVGSFIAQTDLKGKTVAPFFTHGGGGMQHCESDMRGQLAGATVVKGITFSGRSSGAPQEALEKWVNSVIK